MLDRFLSYIKKNKLCTPKDSVLLAVSGGMDSVVMAELFHRAKLKFAIAHCNFRLRGIESDGDEKFVKKLAAKYGVKLYCKRFDTSLYAGANKLSTQMAARELRYEWFEAVRCKDKYKYISLAQHLNDSIETFFINLFRGTGIQGLTGIKAKKKNLIRPLLFTTREEIERFAAENKILFREDSSNLTDDYIRNKIRHHLIPLLNDLNPQFEQIMSGNFSRFAFAEDIVESYIKKKKKDLFRQEEKFRSIKIAELKKEESPAQLLFNMINTLGFNYSQCEEMLNETTSGKFFLTPHYRILRSRGHLLLDENKQETEKKQLIHRTKKNIKTDLGEIKVSVTVLKKGFHFPSSNAVQCVDSALLKFPLTVRKWKTGDYFYPLGMRHRKKLSDFFIDQKSNLFEKERVYVLTSEDKIVCILGHRIDDRFKVTDSTKNVYKVELKYYQS